MTEVTAVQVHHLKKGGVVSVRLQEDKGALRSAFSTRVTVAETAKEVAWTSQPPLTLVIEERGHSGRATIYEFEATEVGLKLFAEVVAALILDAAAAKTGAGSGNGGGMPLVPLLDIKILSKSEENRPLPPTWHYRQKLKA